VRGGDRPTDHEEITMTTTQPAVIARYLAAAEAQDPQACAECFTEDGTVLDEGRTYRGRAEIAGWRRDLVGRFTYTTTITGSEPAGPDGYRVTVTLEGDFPGGIAHLTYVFALRGDLVADLRIVG
jgi:ketosteroid isomerase-like protein